MNSAVDQAVNCIWERYSDPLSLADMARSTMLGRFHLARAFKEQTGVSPGRFLAAVRIYREVHSRRHHLAPQNLVRSADPAGLA